jgi:putative DNA primase/helicase
MMICYGFGANGKSVMSNVILHVVGSYGKTGAPSLLKAKQDNDNGPRADIADLVGSRYVSLNEMQSGDKLDEQVVKILAGREATKARFYYGQLFTLKPTGKIWLKTNHKPIVKEDDDGIWRRLVVIPFARKFSDEERDLHLEEKLKQEAEGILTWIVQGAIDWYSSGLQVCTHIKQESQSYRSESDLLGQFLEEKAELNVTSKTLEGDVFLIYQNWCRGNGNHPLSKNRLTQKLKERGITQSKSGQKRFYNGINLVHEVQCVVFKSIEI